MNDEHTNAEPQRTWLERLGQALGSDPQNRQDLVELLREAAQRDLLDEDTLAMIEGVMQVTEMQVRDIMIPRAQMIIVHHDGSREDLLKTVIESAHSRFPVIGDNRDDVEGILLAKDLLPLFGNGHKEDFEMREVLRPAVFVPESKRLNVLLKEFRSNRNHMAIVVDEYGGVAGLVTIEDVLEQIVGEIEDEYDFDEDTNVLKHNDTYYMVKALTPIDEFNEALFTDFSDEEFDTIGGLVTQHFGHLPKRGEITTIGQLQFRVLRADNRRIHLLEVLVKEETADSVQANEAGC